MIQLEILEPGYGNIKEISKFIEEADTLFIPTLSSRVNLNEYALKLFRNGTKFTYRDDNKLIALSVCYLNKEPDFTFGTYLCIIPEYEKLGLGLDLVYKSIKYAEDYGSAGFRLKMRASNKMLLKFYLKLGFTITNEETYENSDILEYELTKYFKNHG